MSPINMKSGSPLPVGSVAIHDRRAAAAAVRVLLQLPWPSPVSGSFTLLQSELLDFKWLTTRVTFWPEALCWNVCASEGRLSVSMKRGSTADVISLYAPTGVTADGL